jgi:NAD dependent epimerase/dehydratase family enzyme
LENNGVRGAVNVVSPQPVRNAEFTKVLGKIMHRPAFFAAPAFALRLALGEMADGMLLASERVQPAVLEKLGYRFLHPDLAIALKSILA